MRKRNLSRHTVTLAIPALDGSNTQVWQYVKAKGLVQPPKETTDFNLKPSGVEFDAYMEFYTKETLLLSDGSDFPCFIWQEYEPRRGLLNKPYEIIKTRDFIKYGKDTYYKYVGYWNSGKDWSGGRGRPVDHDWDELGKFTEAVDSLEVALELKVAKVDLCSLINN